MHEQRFLIQMPSKEKNEVKAWSYDHIPFEPGPRVKAFRSALRQAISAIKPTGECLYASYYGPDTVPPSDVENLLFYNIGSQPFHPLTQTGLCFERGRNLAFFLPPEKICDARHGYHYSHGASFRHWQKDRVLASWDKVAIPVPKGTHKAHVYWQAMKRGGLRFFESLPARGQFGLDLHIQLPDAAASHLPAYIKPLLDGVIASFHHLNSDDDRLMIARLAALTRTDTDHIRVLLLDDATSVLGAYRVVYSNSQGIIWNPADHALSACRIQVHHSAGLENASLSGEMFSLKVLG